MKVEKNFEKWYNLIINVETEEKAMKVMKKVLLITMIIVLSLVFIQSTVMAYDWSTKISEVGTASTSNGAVTSVENMSKSIITITRAICMGVAVTMLIVLAIKYMSAAPGDKATIKKSAVTYVVGAVIMFAAAGILSIIESFASGI